MLISKIVSGGQTGVDRGALEAAVALGLEFGGWAPHGWIAEDGTVPEQYRERMQEHPSMGGRARDYRERTKANVRDRGGYSNYLLRTHSRKNGFSKRYSPCGIKNVLVVI